MTICVIGTGYVGLVVGSCLAGAGNHVICTDKDEDKIGKLTQCEIPIYEPGLREIVRENLASGRLSFSTDVAGGVRQARVIFVAVGTPPGEDGSADLKHVMAVAETIALNLREDSHTVVVLKSTVPVGTGDKVRAVLTEIRPEADVDVVSNPEFLKEGHAVEDFLRPDRIIVGTESARAREVMSQLYAPFNRTSDRIKFMDVRSSELTKYAANAMLATRISFMNELAQLCEAVGADVDLVRRGIGSDPRIGGKFLFPGVGFGGSCLPKDVRALMGTANEHGRLMRILQSVFEVNEQQKRLLVDRLLEHFDGEVAGLTVAVWGLSFKPRTDDIREAPALGEIGRLVELGVTVRAADPVAIGNARRTLGEASISYSRDAYETLEGADALLIFTEWNEYRLPDFDRMKSLLERPLVFDGRNLYDPQLMRERGFTYYSVGRSPVRSGEGDGASG